MKKYAIVETLKSTRIFTSALTWLLRRTVPSSRKANPACIASTMMAPSRMNSVSLAAFNDSMTPSPGAARPRGAQDGGSARPRVAAAGGTARRPAADRGRPAPGGPPGGAGQAALRPSSCCSSPDSYISRMMSLPPTNSPLT